jgi:dihydroxyacetone kinase-like protein
VHDRRQWLTELDAAIGDGDHGINLDRGLMAVRADLDAGLLDEGDAATLLHGAGRRLLGLVGGASGALYGRGLMAAGEAVRDRTGTEALDPRTLVQVALEGAVAGISALGRAVPGDKTMLDALLPAVAALRQAPPDEPVEASMRRMADAADAGAAATVPLVARKGRASYLGERSAGHLDPGAASSAILVRCLAEAVIAVERRPSVGHEA